LLVLLTWRTEHTPGWLAELDVRRIWLRSLDANAANILLDDLLGSVAGLDALKAHILRHTGQIPLFIEEVARQLTSRGVVEAAGGKISWDALEVPPTVQGVIASRIDRLPKEDKALLQLASVIGPQVSSYLLGTVTGMPAAQLQSRLWSLEILDFLTESPSLASPDYVFAHDLIREVAYESILRAQREVLHRRILSALEANSIGREEDVSEALSHHATRAQDWVKADRYAYMAAKKALARSAFRDATGYFQTAIDAVERLPPSTAREQRAIDLRIEARLAFAPLGSMEQWFALCSEAERRSEAIGDEQRRLASIVAKAVAMNFYGTPFEGITVSEQAVKLASASADSSWLSYAEYVLGQAHFMAGHFRDAKVYLDRSSARLASEPDRVPPGTTGSSIFVLCHMMRAIVHAWLGDFDESQRCCDLATDTAELNDRPYDIVAADYGRGLVQMLRGNLDEAESSLNRASLLSRENEVRLFLPLVMCSLGNLYSQQGDPKRARDILLQAKEEADAAGHATSIVAVSAYLGVAYCQLGQVQHGLSLIRSCQASAKQKGYGGIEALATFAEANVLAAQGAHMTEEAIGCANRVVEIAGRLEAQPLLGAAKGTLARLLAASGRRVEAQDELLQAIALFDRSKMTVHLERAKSALSKFSDV
jgi:tetratricopeptide (TPR) repeat protein